MEQAITFTEDELKILKELLIRTSLTGAEVPAYMQIMQKLSEKPKEEKTNK